jgi:hypothetical protein
LHEYFTKKKKRKKKKEKNEEEEIVNKLCHQTQRSFQETYIWVPKSLDGLQFQAQPHRKDSTIFTFTGPIEIFETKAINR